MSLFISTSIDTSSGRIHITSTLEILTYSCLGEVVPLQYWQDLAQEIANWHFLSVEALPSSRFWKSENDPISRTVKNIVMKFCIHIDIDKM